MITMEDASSPASTPRTSLAIVSLSIVSRPFLPALCSNPTTMGTLCNTSNNPCDLLQPCLNNGTCNNTNITQYGYMCQCPSHFNGTKCQLDDRPCKPDICWNQGEIICCSRCGLTDRWLDLGTCHITVKQSFLCLCVNGWEGDQCESQVNLCRNVQCLNGGVCRPLFLNYICECLGESYSGRYCELTSWDTILHQRLSKSFAYIAIIAMVTAALLVVTMDVLKYGFGIDPAKEELAKMKRKKKKVKGKKTIMVVRYLYVHSSPLPLQS